MRSTDLSDLLSLGALVVQEKPSIKQKEYKYILD